jgi:dTMP kinase
MVATSTLPDLVILVDIDPEIALKRAKSRANLDRIEKEDISFHTRIREGFLSLATEDPNRFLILDGTETEESLEEKTLKAINNLIA